MKMSYTPQTAPAARRGAAPASRRRAVDTAAARQRKLGAEFRRPQLALALSSRCGISSPRAVQRALDTGCAELERRLLCSKYKLLRKEYVLTPNGECVIYVVDASARELKSLCVSFQRTHPLGGLFELEVFDARLSRLPDIPADGAGICAEASLTCSAPSMPISTGNILTDRFLEADSRTVMALAAKSLRYAAWTDPKPGLADLSGCGAGRAANMQLSMSSISVIAEHFRRFFLIGAETAGLTPEQTFSRLRAEGLLAERDMLEATGGVSTHKGAIFLLGVLCGALGRRWKPSGLCRDAGTVFTDCAEMCGPVLCAELCALRRGGASTVGERIYLEHGCRGARGTVIDGFSIISGVSLPILRHGTALGKETLSAGRSALLHLIVSADDSSMLGSCAPEDCARLRAQLRQLLRDDPYPLEDTVRLLDSEFEQCGAAPRGCGALLAVTYFAFLLETPDF